jgi:RNA polymerase sigma-70 factor (ECF subfamily)
VENLPDAELARRASAGDDLAAKLFDERWRPRLFGACFQLLRTHQDAEDCSQTALCHAIYKIATYDDSRPFNTWILKIAYNAALTELRRRKSSLHVQGEPGDRMDAQVPPDRNMIKEEEVQAVKECFATLDKKLRDVMLLCLVEGFSLAKAGEFLGIPKATVQSHLTKGKDQLVRLMKNHGLQ